jgi:hypothetical protein
MSQKLSPHQAALVLNIANMFIGIVCLVWVSTKNPKFPGGKPMNVLARVVIAIFALLTLGSGTYDTFFR